MAEFVPVCKVSELPAGHMTWVAVDRERVLLVNVDGTFYALRDVCGHQRAALSKGRLDGYVVECPLHFARYDVRTGVLLSGPVAEAVPCYAVRVEGDTVYVKQPENIWSSGGRTV
jgi:nitrite reductase/ring-hydroxylating ferredoxin subunit